MYTDRERKREREREREHVWSLNHLSETNQTLHLIYVVTIYELQTHQRGLEEEEEQIQEI